MSGYLYQVPGAAALNNGLAGVIDDQVYSALAAYGDHLRFVMDPATLKGPIPWGYDQSTGKIIRSTRTTTVLRESDADFKGRPVIDFTAADADLHVGSLGAMTSMTWLMVFALDPARHAAGTQSFILNSWSPTNGEEVRWSRSTSGAGGMFFQADVDTGGNGWLSGLSTVGAGETLLMAVSFDAASAQSQQFKNAQVAPLGTFTHTDSPEIDDDTRWFIGNLYTAGASTGWIGQLAFAACIDLPLHLAQYRADFDYLRAAITSKYVV